jgi:integrase
MGTRKSKDGIEVRHRKRCRSPREDGRCCGATFQAQAYDARAGKPVKRTFQTRTAAKLWRSDAQKALRDGDRAEVIPSSRMIGRALDELIAGMRDGTVLDRSGRRYRPATIRSYRQASDGYLKPALGHLRLGECLRGDIQRAVDRMHADGLSGSTIRNKLDPLRVVYRRAMQDDEITRNPTERLRLPALDSTPRQVGDVSRVGALLDALPEMPRALWAVLFYAGLRIGEARALRWTAIDFDAGVIRVQHGWDDHEGEQDPKTDAGTRAVPLIGRVRAELARHKLATGRDGDDLVFGRTADAAFVRSTLRTHTLQAWGWKRVPNQQATGPKTVWVKARADALEPLTPHEARHTAASYMAAAGLTPKEAQEAMGHADIRTTLNIYAKAVPGWQEHAAAKLDAYLDGATGIPARDGLRATVARQSAPELQRSTAVRQRS